ncbi:hypothetical protein NX059_000864 [Plenodomus lindquistii]|nr:hypothetical protein NX059_000864 [Plenodomus lindquistii]
MDLRGPTVKSDEDVTTTNIAIKTLTLPDPAAIAEFSRRRATFRADTSLLPDIRARGLLAFDIALNTDLPTALNEETPVVRLLRTTMRTLGSLYKENIERVTDNHFQAMRQSSAGDEKKTLRPIDPDEEGDSNTPIVIETSPAASSSKLQPKEAPTPQHEALLSKKQKKEDLKRRRQVNAYALHAELARRKVKNQRAKHEFEVVENLLKSDSRRGLLPTASMPPMLEAVKGTQESNDESEREAPNTPHLHSRPAKATTKSMKDLKIANPLQVQLQEAAVEKHHKQAVSKDVVHVGLAGSWEHAQGDASPRKHSRVSSAASKSPTSSNVAGSPSATSSQAPAHVYSNSFRPRAPKPVSLTSPSHHTSAPTTISQTPYRKPKTTYRPLTDAPSLIVKLPFSKWDSISLHRALQTNFDPAKRKYAMVRDQTLDVSPTSSSDPHPERTTKRRKQNVKSVQLIPSEDDDQSMLDTEMETDTYISPFTLLFQGHAQRRKPLALFTRRGGKFGK